MRGLAAFIMQGRARAVAAICGLTALSWLLSLASLLSTAAVALPTLRLGARQGAIVIAAALAVMAGLSAVLLGSPLGAVPALVLWGPVWLLAVLLRESGRLELALGGAALLGIAVVLGIYTVYDDPTAHWLETLRGFAKPYLEQAHSRAETELLWQGLAGFARYMTGLVAAGLTLSLSLGLLIARWWQATLYNPGGFRGEFISLRQPPVAAHLWLGVMALAGILEGGGSEIAWNFALPPTTLFALTGFAVLHALLSGSGGGRFWLAGIYVALLFMSPLLVVIALIGFSDTWIDWRRRFAAT